MTVGAIQHVAFLLCTMQELHVIPHLCGNGVHGEMEAICLDQSCLV